MRNKVIERVLTGKLIVIARGMAEEQILPMAEALHKGGVRMLEVTFLQDRPDSFSMTARSIAAIRKRFGEDMYAGAGTVLTEEHLKLAEDAGAMYIISPSTDPEIIKKTREKNMVSIPGALSASECVTAHNAGADFIKLFPAGCMGVDYFREMRAPLSHVRFLGVAGITLDNIADYIKVGAVGFGIGRALANIDLVEAGEFEKITSLAKQYVQAVAVTP